MNFAGNFLLKVAESPGCVRGLVRLHLSYCTRRTVSWLKELNFYFNQFRRGVFWQMCPWVGWDLQILDIVVDLHAGPSCLPRPDHLTSAMFPWDRRLNPKPKLILQSRIGWGLVRRVPDPGVVHSTYIIETESKSYNFLRKLFLDFVIWLPWHETW